MPDLRWARRRPAVAPVAVGLVGAAALLLGLAGPPDWSLLGPLSAAVNLVLLGAVLALATPRAGRRRREPGPAEEVGLAAVGRERAIGATPARASASAVRDGRVRQAASAPAVLLAIAAAAAAWQDPGGALAGWLWLALLAVYPLGWAARPARVDRRALALAALWFGAALVPRAAGIGYLPLGLHGDEAQHVLVADRILRAGFGTFFLDQSWGVPVPGFLWNVAWVALLGPTVEAARLASAVAGALTVAVVYLWGREIGGRWLGAAAAALLLTAHTHLLLSHLGTLNSQAPLLTAATMLLLTTSWRRRSAAAAALAAAVCAFGVVHWSGARIVAPLVLSGVAAQILRGRLHRIARPLVVFALGVVLLLAAPAAYYARVPGGWELAIVRLDKSVLHPSGWQHTLSGAPSGTVAEVIAHQVRGTLRAFAPITAGDASSFYNFGRPFVDPVTLALGLVGLGAALARPRRARPWVFPAIAVVLTLVSTSLIVDPPNYHRLAIMLPAVALFAARSLEWMRARLPRGHLVAGALVVLIGLLNLKWFFADYPREGEGTFVLVTLTRIAAEQQLPVYVLTPGFPFRHETLALLDPTRRVQPPPAPPEEEERAIWVAVGAVGADGADELAPVRTRHPSHAELVYPDNRGRVVVRALVPP